MTWGSNHSAVLKGEFMEFWITVTVSFLLHTLKNYNLSHNHGSGNGGLEDDFSLQGCHFHPFSTSMIMGERVSIRKKPSWDGQNSTRSLDIHHINWFTWGIPWLHQSMWLSQLFFLIYLPRNQDAVSVANEGLGWDPDPKNVMSSWWWRASILSGVLRSKGCTLPETKIASENRSSPKRKFIETNHPFSGANC